MATATDIEEWADTHASRDQLAILLRMLVNSTCGGLESVDFPGNADAQRPGWDGRVGTAEGNPWVPQGLSGWEFGTTRRVTVKANDDYAKRTGSIGGAARRQMAFVFVTPRRWLDKDSWLSGKRAEGQWRNVLAWDGSDIEQWLEQSIPAQAWFAGRRGLTLRGVKSLERCWVEWCADCKPRFAENVFAGAVSAFGERVRRHLREGTGGLLRIVADSRQEGLAFLAAVLSRPDKGYSCFGDRVVAFTEPGPLSELAVASPGFVPVIADPEVEVELAQSGCTLKAFVVEHRTAVQHESVIALDPLNHQAFRAALASMGLGDDEIERLDRESGRSLTVLRRRLSQSEAIRSPRWSSDEELARVLVPMMLAGAWVTSNDADRYLIGELAGCDYNRLEGNFARLLNLEDSPVWSVGGFHGVVSKVDALYGVSRWMSVGAIDRFIDVAEVVLSERDPTLDLPEGKRWAASLHGKAREISAPLRKGVGESLVLLAIHGRRLYGDRVEPEPERKIADLVRRLLEPMTADKLLSQSSNLPLYAEAAPETFLEIFDREMKRRDPEVAALMKPADDIMFGRSDRVGLLWALELLAWRPEWLDRVVALLARLAELEPDDSLWYRPSESLQSIFRSWMPQTAAPLQHRIAAFDQVAQRHPGIAWSIATAQFKPGTRTGNYTRKPKWRDYGLGFGETVTNGERREFVLHCVETCIRWPSHGRETLADLMGSAEMFEPGHLARVGDAVADWARGALDRDRAWLRERIRVWTFRTIRRNSVGKSVPEGVDEGVLAARKALEVLEPRDPVWKHAWLFENPWVAESWNEAGDSDLKARDERTRTLRLEAMSEVISELGHAGVLRLAFSGSAPNVTGQSAADVIEGEEERLEFVRALLADDDVLASVPHQLVISGFLHGIGGGAAVSVIQALWPERGMEVGVMLLCLAAFDSLIWSKVDGLGGTVSQAYWARVQPSWRRHTDKELNHAVSRLLTAGRPLAALDYVHLVWECVESRHIHGILSDLPKCDAFPRRGIRLDAYTIQQALKVLNERTALNRAELARLELQYLDLFWFDDDGVPNLEQEIEAKPDMFCEAVALIYRSEDDPNNGQPTEDQRNAARKAHRLLDKLARIPGHDNDGVLSAERLIDWIHKAQERCAANGRSRMGDHHIGQLLSKAPIGEDGIWPCAPVREALDAVLNDDIGEGFHIGRLNYRGAHWRGEGGTQEKELAEQYEGWAKASDYSHPKVAAALRGLASSYRSEGRWRDQDAAIQQRLGF